MNHELTIETKGNSEYWSCSCGKFLRCFAPDTVPNPVALRQAHIKAFRSHRGD